ncbi:MAG: hypothetical protein AABX29_07735 [Nanoarchaeota archaeon]
MKSSEKREVAINYETTILKNGFRYNYKLPSDMEVNCGKIICEILKIPYGKVIFNERIIIHPFELDIFIPSKKLAIEIQDKKSHYGKNKRVSDNNFIFKKGWCIKLGIRLIRIPYNFANERDIRYILEWDNNVYKRKTQHYEKVKNYYND